MKKNLIFVFIFISLAGNAAFAATPNYTIGLTPYWPTPPTPTNNTDQYYGITLTGSAFDRPIFARLDTEADTLIIPAKLLSKKTNAYTIVDPHTVDEWDNPAELVIGNVTLTGTNGTQYSVNMPFYAETSDSATGYYLTNFGAGMSVFPNPQEVHDGFSHTCPTTNPNCSQIAPGSAQHCVGGFFSYYNYPVGTQPGFTINANNSAAPTLTIGSITPGTLTYSLPHQPVYNCVAGTTANTVITKPLPACTGLQFWGTTIPNITIAIQNTTVTQPIAIPNLETMIDTGGGPIIIRDDATGTYTAELKNISSPCPASFSFLNTCECLTADHTVSVSNANNTLNYNYRTSDISQTQQFAVAVCPDSAFGPNGSAPFIFPNGANLGYAFFNRSQSVSYNMDTCTINATDSGN